MSNAIPNNPGERYNFSNLTPEQKDEVLRLAAEFLTESPLEEFTDFVLYLAWEKAESQIPCDPSPFCIQRQLLVFHEGLRAAIPRTTVL